MQAIARHAGDGAGPRDQEAEHDHAGHDEPRQRRGDEQGDAAADGADEQRPREAQPAALALLLGGRGAREGQDRGVEGHGRPLGRLGPGRPAQAAGQVGRAPSGGPAAGGSRGRGRGAGWRRRRPARPRPRAGASR